MIMSGAFCHCRTPKHRVDVDAMRDETMLGDASYLSVHLAGEQDGVHEHG